ncbi:hypothetical protein GQS52_18060 [Streptomyces sp. SCUT-3]|uniref:hypothetical protein n=1 Tax=Streptomyces sp. SCUT-3 TaxID=2684469 RepID=UPI0015F793F0|nr:hypothetical protein [Streptomyces sp. SCUT-3]QMV23354.1 hypothetical protein GQS52_18060 [Streptomyces sp. SCUT-3]
MRSFIGRHQAVTDDDFFELALGTPLELWLGEEGESDEERAARLDAARDILADDPGLYDRAVRAAVRAVEHDAPHLLVLPITPRPVAAGRRAVWKQVAA